MQDNCLINGIPTAFIHVSDRGFNYGDGVFETILYSDGGCQFWDQHISRMKKAAEKLKIAFPGESCYWDDVVSLIERPGTQDYVIKLMLTRGSSERGYAVRSRSLPLRVTSIYAHQTQTALDKGIRATLCKQTASINEGLTGIKHLNRLENIVARNEWHDQFHEGIMLDDEKNVIEGTMSNLFIMKGNQLQTPDLSRSGISGVIRENILSIAEDENLDVAVRRISIDDLFDADECFVTNSIIGIWPINSIESADHDTVEYSIGEKIRTLQERLRQRCKDHAKTIK